MFKKNKFLIGGLILVLAVGYLAYSGFQSSATYYYTVSELNELNAGNSPAYGENLRVSGQVVDGSVEQDTGDQRISFALVDLEGEDSLPVVYQGIVPDTFMAGRDVVVEGRLNMDGVFQAESILTKCPSKYEPEK